MYRHGEPLPLRRNAPKRRDKDAAACAPGQPVTFFFYQVADCAAGPSRYQEKCVGYITVTHSVTCDSRALVNEYEPSRAGSGHQAPGACIKLIKTVRQKNLREQSVERIINEKTKSAPQLASFSAAHHVPPATYGTAFVIMVLTMIVVRTTGVILRGRAVGATISFRNLRIARRLAR